MAAGVAVPVGAQESEGIYGDVFPTDYDNIAMRPSGQPYDSINSLREMGVFEGTDCGDNKFCPTEPIDRKTFAVWLVRVLDGDDAGAEATLSSNLRFGDIAQNDNQRGFVERLADLGVTNGCSLEPALYCPTGTISRAQLATFVTKALDLPAAEAIGFWDVEKDSRHFASINSFVKSELDDGCSELRFVPFNYCPDQLVSKGELAELLVRIVDYIEADEIIGVDPNTSSDNSIGLTVDHEERTQTTKVSWRNPAGKPSNVDYYVLQWQMPWSGFSYQRYQVVEFDSQQSRYRIDFNYSADFYAIRVVTVYINKTRSVTDTIKVPSQNRQLRDVIKERIIDVYGDSQPWLVDTWRHVNGPDSILAIGRQDQVSISRVGGGRPWEGRYAAGRLKQPFVRSVSLSEASFRSSSDYTRTDFGATIHELGHAYTLTGGITKNEAPTAIGYLYLGLLVKNHLDNSENPGRCITSELYANLAEVAFHNYSPIILDGFGSYWTDCGFNFDHQTQARVMKEVKDIAQKVFVDQETPQWFYDTYQLGNGSINLDRLWGDMSSLGHATGFPVEILSYGLRNEFGGYCSREEVRKFTTGEIKSLKTPWVDAGGCQPTDVGADPVPPEEPEIGAGSGSVSGDCASDTPIVVASDAAAESDRYSATTLAGVIGTDCIILAGARDAPFPAAELARLQEASAPGYVVGGAAAVPEGKTSGWDLKRLAGTDRWHTARLVGAEAVLIAGGTDTGNVEASAGAQDPTTDCAGDTPIVVASDHAAQSDRYSAATLAGVIGTDCIILAGARDAPFGADQLARLRTAAAPGYIVGGIAAVPDTKTAGWDLARIAGTDRWATARLVGDHARRIAATQPADAQ